MKNKILKNIILLFAIFFLYLNLTAQIKTKIFYSNIPSKYKLLSATTFKRNTIEAPAEFYALRNKKNATEEIRFAFAVKTNIDFIKEAILKKENGVLKYSLSINAKDALNMSLHFSEFKLPENAILSIYTKNEFTDSITSNENNENNSWATRVYQGNTLYIVLEIPSAETEKAKIKIGTVNFGYKNLGVLVDFGLVGASATCEINANCPAGTTWGNEKNSVALIVANGLEHCTGALIMNACNTNIPYVLTANHCLTIGNTPNWVFQFQTLSTDCATNTGWREDIQFNGCTLRANNAITDFALLQLNNSPLPASGLFYSGWSRQTTGNTSVTILHHPVGDLMKISSDINPPIAINDATTGADCWLLNLDIGIVEGGSSGAPYYNQNHQIIGQHFRRPQNVGNPPPLPCNMTGTLGGRFDQSWVGGGTNATRLSNWLDPNNLGTTFTNTTNISSLSPPITNLSITGITNICVGTTSTYSVNVAAGTTVNWVSSNPAIATVPPSGNPVTVTKVSNGNVTLTANVSSCGIPLSTSKTIRLGAYTSSDYTFSGNNGSPLYCTNQTISFTLNGAFGTNYVWTVPTGWTTVYNGGSNYITIKAPSSAYPPTGTLSVSFTEPCGSTVTASTFLAYSSSACTGDPRYTYSPNPAPSVLNVAVASGYLGNTWIRKIELVKTSTGASVYFQDYTYGNVTNTSINMSGYPSGTYTLRIYDGSAWATYSIVH